MEAGEPGALDGGGGQRDVVNGIGETRKFRAAPRFGAED